MNVQIRISCLCQGGVLGLGVWVKEQLERHWRAENRLFAYWQGSKWAQRPVVRSGDQPERVLWERTFQPLTNVTNPCEMPVFMHVSWVSYRREEALSSKTDRRLETVMTAHGFSPYSSPLLHLTRKEWLWLGQWDVSPKDALSAFVCFSGDNIITLLDK